MPRLLLVEDEIGVLASLKRTLARAGFEVLVATNLPDALSAAENDRPDAMLVAAGLQGETASTLVEAIRAVDLIRPVIVMGDGSGTGEPSLPKPIDPLRLIELLGELVPGAVAMPNVDDTDETDRPDLTLARASPSASLDPPPDSALAPIGTQAVRQAQTAEARGAVPSDLARRRELAAKALAEAQARRRAAEAMRAAVPPPATTPLATIAATPVPAPVAPAPAPTPKSSPPVPLPAPPQVTVRAPPVALPAPPPKAIEPAPAVTYPQVPAPKSLDAELFGDLSGDSLEPAAELRLRSPRADPAPVAKPEPPPKPPFPPEGLEVPLSGSLERVEPAALLVACHRARLTGHLRLDQGAVQRLLYFNDGRLSGAGSTSAEERLEALSYRRGLITREQQRLLRAETQIPTRRLALVMVERSYLKPAELFPLVQERVEEIIYEACGGFVGDYEILPDQVPDDERVALSRSPIALATEGIRRKYLMDRLLGGLGGPATLLRPARERGPELADFGLTARERRLVQAVDGLRNIEELLFESGIEPLPGLKTLYALLLGRSVEIAVRGLAVDATPEAEARIDLARVSEKYAQVRSANYFEVLGVPSSATAYEIAQAYDRLSREFQPGRFRELRRPDLPGQLDEIQRVLAEARDVLVDEGLRDEYRAHLRGG